MMVEIDPALSGQPFGEGQDINQVLLAMRHRGHTLFAISERPAYVYVARVLDAAMLSKTKFAAGEIELIGWATLFPTLRQAAEYARRFDEGAEPVPITLRSHRRTGRAT